MKTALSAIGLAAVVTVAISNVQLNQSRQPTPPFWSDLKAGQYSVGFRVLYRRDHHRPWLKAHNSVSDPGRPIRLGIWYPATPSASAEAMKYGDYLHHEGPEGFRNFNQQLDKNDIDSWLSDLSELSPSGHAIFEKLLSMPVAAYHDAPAAHGRFPLVLYSGGKGSRADANVELAEYLASHGYVIATVPQLGPSDQEIELGSSAKEISLHADDFDAALTILHELPEIDFSHIATAGHSAGGEAAVELALRHPEIAAVIGLDASYGMSGGARILAQIPEYAPGREVHAALLDLRRANGSQGVTLDLSAIDALHWPDEYRIVFANAFHGDFTEWGCVGLKLAVPMPSNPDGHTRQMGYEVNLHAYHAILDFLDARLRGDKSALQRVESDAQDLPGAKFIHLSAPTKAGT